MPFMDYRLVTFAFSIPWTSKLRNGFSKSIIRAAMSPYLPPEIAYRKVKIGFNSPMLDWLKGPLKAFFLDLIHSESFRKCELIYPLNVAEKIQRVIRNPNASFSAAQEAWLAVSPYLWEQAVVKRSTGDPTGP